MNILIVVAHPDDEVLGVGGTAPILVQKRCKVISCIICSKADARSNRPDEMKLYKNILKAQQILGLDEPILGDFPNIRLNTIPHIELVRFIEDAIIKSRAQIIFTHHPSDLNNDHYHVSIACQAAARIYQRKETIPSLKGLYFMEILSSTDWAFAGQPNHFIPDTFVDIEKTLNKKIEALKVYRGVLRKFPHPRSEKIIRGLAAYRGGQAGLKNAEAFQTAFKSGIL